LQAYAPGIYARSEELIQATRDLDRGRTTPEAVDEAFERDLRELVAVQEEAGLDLLSDGMLRAQDLFRPLAEAAEGLDARPLTRFLDTNTFYRAVLVEGTPALRDPLPAPDLPEGRWLATLPAPLAFARAARGALSAQAAAEAIIAPEVDAFAQKGCGLLVLSDPFLLSDPSLFERGVEETAESLAKLPDGVPVMLHLPFGDASGCFDRLAELSVDAIGIDFYATALESVPEDYPKGIAAGVIDARSSALEDPEEIARFVEQLLERNPNEVSLIPSGDLQFVPERIAREKLVRLGRARATLTEGVPA
jgi:5-methyltetrahydropteroyltriglutamate--homocysteine methyltransferase